MDSLAQRQGFPDFLKAIGRVTHGEIQGTERVLAISPNRVAVVLWIHVDDVVILLGSDLEKRGWVDILHSPGRPKSKAGVFKVPHHGGESANESGIWQQLLVPNPLSILTPWTLGKRRLPSERDVRRILSHTSNAYATSSRAAVSPRKRGVDKTIRESKTKLKRLTILPGLVRMRRRIGSGAQWQVETMGSACDLKDFA